MIDSSGRRALRANGTVLDLVPIGQAIAVTGTLLVGLFVLVKPEASNGLGTAGRILFWGLHVGLGLAALAITSRWLASRIRLPNGTLAAVLVTGCASVVIAAPGYLVLDRVFEAYVIDLDASPVAGSIASALIGETLELAPWFLATWVIINLPVLLPRPVTIVRMDDAVEHELRDQPDTGTDMTRLGTSGNRRGPSAHALAGSVPGPRLVDAVTPARVLAAPLGSPRKRFLSSLPGIVGTDVVAVASDLHYLNVWTVAGRTTVLGTLKEVVEELDTEGIQVHRSYWVAHAHVRRIVGTAGNAACILSNELRIPVSRRRWKAVREQYGRGVVHSGESNEAEARIL